MLVDLASIVPSQKFDIVLYIAARSRARLAGRSTERWPLSSSHTQLNLYSTTITKVSINTKF